MNSTQQYKCGSCESVYGQWDEAAQCCPVETVYVCQVCESWYGNKNDADKCCAEGDGDE